MSLYQDWLVKHSYFKSKDGPLKDRYAKWRGVARSIPLSPRAQLRLEWIIFYESVAGKNAKLTSRHFGISRKTLHKWLGRFDERNLRSLEEQSRRPEHTRGWEVTSQEERRVVKLRKKHLKYGKKKLQRLYQRKYGEYISTWKIERVVRKWNLYPDPQENRKSQEKKASSKPKLRIHQIKEAIQEVKEFGFLWHLDAVIIWWYGTRRVIFTALEEKTKLGYARVYNTNKAGYAEDFLKRLMYLVQGKIHLIHSDNGAEFQGAFERALKALGILQVYSRPRTPKDNPALERFNWTLQDEWLSLSQVGLDRIEEANKDLTEWLVEYNQERPHQALDYLSPLEYAQEHYFQVLPMWSASTRP